MYKKKSNLIVTNTSRKKNRIDKNKIKIKNY